MLCSWARHFTLTVPLSTQVYKWILSVTVLVNLMLACDGLASHPGGNRNTPTCSCFATETGGLTPRLMSHDYLFFAAL